MSKREPGIIRLGLTLALFAAAACVVLAFVYQGTKDIIERREDEELEAALTSLFPGADQFSDITGRLQSPDPAVSFEGIFEVRKGQDLIGAALQVSRTSYGGPLTALVGVNAGGTIAGVRILEHSDTPGLGANADSPSFTGQFTGKAVGDPFKAGALKDGADVEAVTASTITSTAVADAVKAAGRAAAVYLEAAGE
jgi:electron transport complex protein RnfG